MSALLNFFLPPRCLFCGQIMDSFPNIPACSSCLTALIFFSSPKCPKCGIGFASAEGPDHLCPRCLTDELHFTLARALGPYEGLMAELITRFKYQGATYLAHPLGMLLADYKDADFSFGNIDLLVPVPLHPRRLRERGFNQSLLLARVVSRVHKIPLQFNLLERIRYTQPQTQLSGSEREKNMRGAFRVRKNNLLSRNNILLIDDVFTSGATVGECARALKEAGARQVQVLTLARAI
ncbi:MAG: double zinc ribbon domain-containing protein [Thermodesulfobacteriota bacterium]